MLDVRHMYGDAYTQIYVTIYVSHMKFRHPYMLKWKGFIIMWHIWTNIRLHTT